MRVRGRRPFRPNPLQRHRRRLVLAPVAPGQLRLGWAHGAFLTTYHGDVTMARLEEVEAFARGESARVQR